MLVLYPLAQEAVVEALCLEKVLEAVRVFLSRENAGEAPAVIAPHIEMREAEDGSLDGGEGGGLSPAPGKLGLALAHDLGELVQGRAHKLELLERSGIALQGRGAASAAGARAPVPLEGAACARGADAQEPGSVLLSLLGLQFVPRDRGSRVRETGAQGCWEWNPVLLLVRHTADHVDGVRDHARFNAHVERGGAVERGPRVDLDEPAPERLVDHDIKPKELEADVRVRNLHLDQRVHPRLGRDHGLGRDLLALGPDGGPADALRLEVDPQGVKGPFGADPILVRVLYTRDQGKAGWCRSNRMARQQGARGGQPSPTLARLLQMQVHRRGRRARGCRPVLTVLATNSAASLFTEKLVRCIVRLPSVLLSAEYRCVARRHRPSSHR